MDKTILLASFIFKDKLEWFLNYLNKKFNINQTSVFLYDISDDNKVMVTYKLIIKEGEKLNFKNEFSNANIVHKKGDAIYSINGLNKLIDNTNSDNIGNIDYKTIKINWSDYQNKLILVKNNNLSITDIKRILL
jgi:hypothetical protein